MKHFLIVVLIIFTGHMYGKFKNDENLQPIKYIQMKKRYESRHYNEHLGSIHVVHYDAL